MKFTISKIMSIPSHTGLFKEIREIYDSKIVGIVRHYIGSSEKIASTKQHLTFNLRPYLWLAKTDDLRVS